MFKKRNLKQENVAAAINIPRPMPAQTVHNHAPSEAGRILAQWFVYLILAVIGWFVLLYLIREMGYKNPARALGWFLFGGVGLLIISIAVDKVITKHAKAKREFLLQLEEIRAETARHNSLIAAHPQPGESRLTEEDSKFAALLRMVMQEAYTHLHDAGQYGRNEAKPWSRRANKGREIPGFKDPVTEDMASRVSRWLESKGVIDKNGLINEGAYPGLAHFVALLEEEYYTPIQVQKTLSPIIQRDGYNFVN